MCHRVVNFLNTARTFFFDTLMTTVARRLGYAVRRWLVFVKVAVVQATRRFEVRSTLLRGIALSLMYALAITMASSLSWSQNNSSVVVIRMTNDKKFVPQRVTIKVGETVEWVNEPDGPEHTVTDDPDKVVDPSYVSSPKGTKPFDSGVIGSGKSFRYTFKTPGTYRYACLPHPAMRGEITVTQ
jgi:plastocyanin